LLPVRTTERGLQFATAIIQVGYLWPLMKAINLLAGALLITNRAPAFALALLAPVTVVIIWFQVLLNPLPVPLVTVVLVVICEAMLLRAYAGCYAGMFRNGIK
jgi:putative oxidoreductase